MYAPTVEEKRRRMLHRSNNNGNGAYIPLSTFFAPLRTSIVPQRGVGSAAFTRATVATVTDWEGVIRRVLSGEARFHGARRVYNQVSSSNPDAWATKVTTTVTSGVSDPLGGSTAYTLTATAATAFITGSTTQSAGRQVRTSYWVRRRTGSGGLRFYDGGDGSNNATLTSVVTSEWRRIACDVQTAGGTGTNRYGFIIEDSGDEIDVWMPQLEDVTGQTNQAPGEVVSVGVLSAPYHGANVDGVKYFDTENGNTVASNVVTEATGAPISGSYFAREEARTNLCLQSEEFDEAAWVSGGGGVAVDDQSTASPDGAVTADTLTASGANGTLIQDLGVIASAAKTFSIWLKRKTGTGNIDLTLDGGATWTTKTITSSWARYDITQTLADPDCGIRIVTSGDEVYAWGAQVENNTALLSTYIPTTSAAVARNQDRLSYQVSGNISGVTGTFAADMVIPAGLITNVAAGYAYGADAGSNRDLLIVQGSSSKLGYYDGTTVALGNVITPSTSLQRFAMTWGGSAGKTYIAGTPSASLPFDGDMNVISNVVIGNTSDYANNGPVGFANVRIWLQPLSDSQVKAL